MEQLDDHSIKVSLLLITLFVVILITIFTFLILLLSNRQASMRNDFEKTLLTTRLEIREQTFQDISLEIHDNIGLALSLALVQLDTVPRKELHTAGVQFDGSMQIIRNAIDELRSLTKMLHTDYIREQGLLHMLNLEIEKIKKAGIFNVQYEVIGDPIPMDTNKELFILRIIQEGLNNTIKHAGASNIWVLVHYGPESIEVELADNGKGFDPLQNNTSNKSGTGLINIVKRAKLMDGICEINGEPGKGTTINLKIPY